VRRPVFTRARVTWKRAIAWLAVVAVLLVGADLAERFVLYDLARRDRGSLARLARRPVKDTALKLLHAVPSGIDPARAPGVPVFDFYLKPEDETFLRARIARVQIISTHDEVTKEEVPARLAVDGQDYDVRIKLRGRQYYHVVPPRVSLRVDLRHGRSYRGSTLFNLIDPFDKTGDQVFLWESQAHDLIGWDTTMGILAMRGEPLAVVQYVEQPRIETGDRAGRPEGMFFRGSGEHYSEGADPERCGQVVERVARWLGDTTGTISWEELQELFDVERLGWFTALTEFSGDGHGFADFNMKGFCDPVSLKAEMLIWDTRFGDWSGVATSQFAEMGTQLLRCDRFRLVHDRALYALATERLAPMLARADDFFERYGEMLEQDRFQAFPRGGPDGGFMGDRQEKMRRTLEKNARDIVAALTGTHLEWHLDTATRTLELATDDRGPKELVALEIAGGDGTVRQDLPEPVEVAGRYRERRPVRLVALPADVPPETVRGVLVRNLCGGAEVRAVRSEQPLAGERASWTSQPALAALPELPDGARADAAAAEVSFGPGTVRVSAPLSLPRGWRVRFEPGTELVLARDVFVEIRGDLVMPGRGDAPILVRGDEGVPWGAFAVLGERGAPLRVDLAHATFRGGAGSNAGAVRCTGSVALYFTDLTMDHVTVEQNTSEDAINPKFSTVRATDCLYRDGASDAVDYDFCTGTDLRTRVERFGNDGIDVSGSRMRVEGAIVRDVGDKGLSVGEGSRPEYVDVSVIGAHTGVAVKDRSDARFERLTIVRADTALALYVKKPSFGPSQALFRDLLVLDSDAMAVLDQGCAATFAGARRLGTGRLRPFEGVTNVEEPGLGELTLEELLERAEELRDPHGASDVPGRTAER
jgi:hypothetical protein